MRKKMLNGLEGRGMSNTFLKALKDNTNLIEKSLGGYTVSSIAFLGMKYNEKDNEASIVFLCGSSLNEEDLFLQTNLILEDKIDMEYIKNCPLLYTNLTDDLKENFNNIIKGAKIGENFFITDFMFEKPVMLSKEFYQIKSLYYSDNILRTKNVVIKQPQYLQISMFIYWLLGGYPPAIDVFLDYSFEKSTIYSVSSVTFDGSCLLDNGMMMSHYTLNCYEGLERINYGFNIPIKALKGVVEVKPMLWNRYQVYTKDPMIMPDKIFFTDSPEISSIMITKSITNPNEHYKFFRLSEEVIKKYRWMDWKYHIYGKENKKK